MNRPKPRVLVIGDLMLDVYEHLVDDLPNPEGEGRVYFPQKTEQRLGGAGAAAMLVSSLGAEPVLIAAMETRSNGRIFRRLLDEAAVENATLEVEGVSLTSRSRRVAGGRLLPDVVESGGQTILGVGRVLERLERIDALAAEEGRPGFAAIAIADYGKGVVGPRLVAELRQRYGMRPIYVLASAAADWKIYRGCDVLLCERSQFESRLAHAIERPNHLLTVDRFAGVGWTLGCAGAKRRFRWQQLTTELVDAAGVNETLLASLGCFWTDKRLPMEAAIPRAMRLASWQAAQLGISPISPGAHSSAPLSEPDDSASTDLPPFPDFDRIPSPRVENPSEHPLEAADWKIIDLPEAVTHAQTARRHGRKIVVVEGRFLSLHAGHLSTLRFARRQGDVLFVGLRSDEAIAQEKGARPVLDQLSRARMLAALPEVDWVVNFDGDTAGLLEALAPDVLVGCGRRRLPHGWEFARGYKGAPFVLTGVQGLKKAYAEPSLDDR